MDGQGMVQPMLAAAVHRDQGIAGAVNVAASGDCAIPPDRSDPDSKRGVDPEPLQSHCRSAEGVAGSGS
jgi:hypothetical protein